MTDDDAERRHELERLAYGRDAAADPQAQLRAAAQLAALPHSRLAPVALLERAPEPEPGFTTWSTPPLLRMPPRLIGAVAALAITALTLAIGQTVRVAATPDYSLALLDRPSIASDPFPANAQGFAQRPGSERRLGSGAGWDAWAYRRTDGEVCLGLLIPAIGTAANCTGDASFAREGIELTESFDTTGDGVAESVRFAWGPLGALRLTVVPDQTHALAVFDRVQTGRDLVGSSYLDLVPEVAPTIRFLGSSNRVSAFGYRVGDRVCLALVDLRSSSATDVAGDCAPIATFQHDGLQLATNPPATTGGSVLRFDWAPTAGLRIVVVGVGEFSP